MACLFGRSRSLPAHFRCFPGDGLRRRTGATAVLFNEIDAGFKPVSQQPALHDEVRLSPRVFNELTARCIACPVTWRDRDWSFHVPIPDGHEISGVVQADQLRSASWEQRGSRFISKTPPLCILAVLHASQAHTGYTAFGAYSAAPSASCHLRLECRYSPDLVCQFAFCIPSVISALHPNPDPGAIAEQLTETDGDGRGNRFALV